MGTVGGLVATGVESPDRLLSESLSLSARGDSTRVVSRGAVVIGVSVTNEHEDRVSHGSHWSVAVCGVVDAVGDVEGPDEPALEIARALDSVGVSAAEGVLGEFSCVATDGRRLLAFRDHLGTDGLFVAASSSRAAVMSEPKQVVHALGRPRRHDLDALVSVFFAQYEDEVPCVVEGVDRVPRGFVIEAEPGGWRQLTRIWDPAGCVATSELSAEDAAERAWELISAAVVSSVSGPTAVSLSGGVDSTLIAAALGDWNGRERVGAISAVYPDSPSVDESGYISETVNKLGLASTTYNSSRKRLEDVELWVDRFDGPTYGLAIGPVAEMNDVAAKHGYQTILSGELAEYVYDLREHALGTILMRGHPLTFGRHVTQLRAKGMKWSSLTRLVGAALMPSKPALAYALRKPRQASVDWLDPTFLPGLKRRWDLERPPSKRWSDIQYYFATGPSLPGLEISTNMGDVAGVRTRRPLLSRELWEFFLSLPPEVKFPDAWTKSLVRHSLGGRAPDSVVWRTDKTVFDEDSLSNAEFPELVRRLSDGFRLPGVNYDRLIGLLDTGEMKVSDLILARSLASIHEFVRVAS